MLPLMFKKRRAEREKLSPYFNSHARLSPLRAAFLKNNARREPGYNDTYVANTTAPDGGPGLVPVTANNYPRLYAALKAECTFRGVAMPACYVDRLGGPLYLGMAHPDIYAIRVQEAAYNLFDADELRALIAHELKHMYQGKSETAYGARLNELDADRAAVQSIGYAVIRRYVHKVAAAQATILPQSLRGAFLKFHRTFPNLLAEHVWLRTDKHHPSPARRMKEMRREAKKPPAP